MSQTLSISRLANLGAKMIHTGFDAYQMSFAAITKRAKSRFEKRDWRGMQTDAVERLDVYKLVVDRAVADIRTLLRDDVYEKLVWISTKAVYSGLIADRDDYELAETFFNSITRRIFTTVGVDKQIEFVDTDFETPPKKATDTVFHTYSRAKSTALLIEKILSDYRFEVAFENLSRDTALASAIVGKKLQQIGTLKYIERAEIIKPVFYRDNRAFLIGRLFSGSHTIPIALALQNLDAGITVDAILLEENDLSILFGFTRSYFHVEVVLPCELVLFIKSIIPRKKKAEIYISIGYNKHGKTEFYRDLLHHLAYTNDEFDIAKGQPGMVMEVFAMPSYDVVFKIIKDHFMPPKKTTRRQVMSKYRLIFKHDRAGRLVDAQEFEHLQFSRDRFSEQLIEQLLKTAGGSVKVQKGNVNIDHAYMERQLTPLNIFLQEADTESAQLAVIDLGQAIKDLAAANIFPGDLLLKNFGVTRHGRVVFYDYDEVCLLTSCNFRKFPQARTFEDELSAEPWFSVGENDIFPEEFQQFLWIPKGLEKIFLEHHAELFTFDFWQNMQTRINNGEVIHTVPYHQSRRLQNRIFTRSRRVHRESRS